MIFLIACFVDLVSIYRESGDKIGEKLNDLLVCLSSLDKQLFEQWKADLPDTCEQCLNQPLFIVQPETHQLNVNFDKKVGTKKKKSDILSG
jgi:Dynein heavy chain, N-terminal region 1.